MCGMRTAALLCGILTLPAAARADGVAEAIGILRQVGPEGKGNAAAAQAWRIAAAADPSEIPTLLAGLDGANDLAANWIRSAVDAIAGRTLAAGNPLPAEAIEAFLVDRSHDPRGRRLAYELLVRVEPSASQRLIPKMLDDPSVELRRDAVARLIEEGEAQEKAGKKDQAADLFAKAFDAARDQDQIKSLKERLAKLGRPVDLPLHYGFIMDWKLVGPFDNRGGIGFAAVYPPEKNVNLADAFPGLNGEVRWKEHVTADEYGKVDLNHALGKANGVVAYAVAEFTSDEARPVELRLGCVNAWKLWLNGEYLFGREEYHSGMDIDQYRMRGKLKPGKNVILLKVCQNEQKESWAQRWTFQLRVCDATGTAILSTTRPPSEKKDQARAATAKEKQS